jgi:opacity protein-like surface antigen
MTMAADTPAIEVFGGYSMVVVDTTTAFGQTGFDLNLNGWDGQVAFNGNKWAGFVADFGGYYGSIEDTFSGESASVHVHSIMFGPRIAIRRGSVTPFIQALFGYARISAEAQGENVFKENDFAMAFGGGLDVNVTKTIALRPVQIDYFTTKTGLTGDFAGHFRYSAEPPRIQSTKRQRSLD